jgi:hypothetical protein
MPTARTGTRIASRTKASGEISISDTHAQRLRVLPLHPTFQRQREVPRGSQFSDSRLLRAEGGSFFVGMDRNALPLPVYGRLDLRANRTFAWPRRRLALFAG